MPYKLNPYTGEFDYYEAGSGDVTGPLSAVNSNLALYDGLTGKLIKDGGYSPSSFDAAGAAGAVQSNLNTHEGLASTVHNFDASGNAPPKPTARRSTPATSAQNHRSPSTRPATSTAGAIRRSYLMPCHRIQREYSPVAR